jgi:hypothetical protein
MLPLSPWWHAKNMEGLIKQGNNILSDVCGMVIPICTFRVDSKGFEPLASEFLHSLRAWPFHNFYEDIKAQHSKTS